MNNKFNKGREAEMWLYNYKSIKAGIENLKEEYEVLNDTTQLALLDNRIKGMERKIQQVDRALDSLSNIEREIIQYKCIEGMRYYEFTYKVYTGERQCMRIKQRALNKIAVALGL